MVGEALNNYLEEHPEAKTIVNKVILRATAAILPEKQEKWFRKIFYHQQVAGKLADCSEDRLCELYLVEGDSAIGTAKRVEVSSNTPIEKY